MSVTPPPLPPSSSAGGPDPEPRPHAAPLDRAEERSLAGLEDELRRSDPDLDGEMAALAAARRVGPGGTADRVLQVIAIAVIVGVLLPGEWLPVVLSLGLLVGVPVAMAVIAARATREPGPGDPENPDRQDP